jgi:hypothetical protein
MAMPTRKSLKWLAIAITNNARPYTTDGVRTKIFHRPVRSENFPPMTQAATMTHGSYRIRLIEPVEEAGYWCAGN